VAVVPCPTADGWRSLRLAVRGARQWESRAVTRDRWEDGKGRQRAAGLPTSGAACRWKVSCALGCLFPTTAAVAGPCGPYTHRSRGLVVVLCVARHGEARPGPSGTAHLS
jgi:hypothetical protein